MTFVIDAEMREQLHTLIPLVPCGKHSRGTDDPCPLLVPHSHATLGRTRNGNPRVTVSRWHTSQFNHWWMSWHYEYPRTAERAAEMVERLDRMATTMTYAARTDVSVEKSRAEIEKTLTRWGATSFGYGVNAQGAMIVFEAQGRRVRFVLPLPNPNEKRFTHHSQGARTPDAAQRAWEQACRSAWRALNLIIKAKLEAVETGIVSFEEEFLAHTLLPSGATVSEWMQPQIEQAYQTGAMPALLPGLPPAPTGA